ncbi:hypothetical protein [Acaryochloris marina]|uniref:hypothetical protein n=1 Tax=Acaryochloris marina TaxID=155978 RepID=UPI00059FD7A1|nr:hypothetical protein [Acaryochloris marina]
MTAFFVIEGQEVIVEKILFAVLLLSTSYLLWDGFTSGSVWVRGGRRTFEFGKWAHKKHRHQEPTCYWIAMAFYGSSAIFSLYALVFVN